MPIIESTNSTAPVFSPEFNYEIAKYLDLTKFISLLQKKSLFFCRLDRLEDKFEGKTARGNYDARFDWLKSSNTLLENPLSEKEVEVQVNSLYELGEKMKGLTCVNCWNKFDGESAALWKIYSDFNKGIMIKSSIEQLRASFQDTEKEIQLSEIRYIDYRRQLMPDGNTNFPIIHKQKAYTFEEEVRIFHVINPITGWEHNWENEEIQDGLYISVNLNSLISQIVISPFAANWFVDLIKDLLDKYNINKPVYSSELA